ncbi:MAG: 50S ribosomal protein L4 [Candidatus Nealsonbacteria bacterium CG08_land_8_20_14_0_20_38_20]|uniref:Large ribosomal subunit protein uL4 n=1 Tax=Candidatus Nealsonbacteria bacterium CG08_land_8_20_14_0_20_38_20 TaxID=1974705 RepID=A0A2H0YLL5_9BACT|nr:MAG: 50S ribosomal protein L4 [Candidatus Nealsonbacteria bacterium CG08_land_8_20_14_0_20_38_20]
MKVAVYNQKGEEVGTTLLPEEIFAVKVNPDLIHQVSVSQLANRRKRIANTKGRGEVSGGGRKPWPQKHMGKARHGSIRSPLWRHGGITFGPTKEKVFKREIPKKMKRKALLMVLAAKVKSNLLIILDKIKLDRPKTKLMAKVIENLRVTPHQSLVGGKKGSILLILPEMNENLILAARNLPKVTLIQAKDLNCLDMLSSKYLIILKESVKVIKETFLKND